MYDLFHRMQQFNTIHRSSSLFHVPFTSLGGSSSWLQSSYVISCYELNFRLILLTAHSRVRLNDCQLSLSLLSHFSHTPDFYRSFGSFLLEILRPWESPLPRSAHWQPHCILHFLSINSFTAITTQHSSLSTMAKTPQKLSGLGKRICNKWTYDQKLTLYLMFEEFGLTPESVTEIFNALYAVSILLT